jgi:hypothetical protein
MTNKRSESIPGVDSKQELKDGLTSADATQSLALIHIYEPPRPD